MGRLHQGGELLHVEFVVQAQIEQPGLETAQVRQLLQVSSVCGILEETEFIVGLGRCDRCLAQLCLDGVLLDGLEHLHGGREWRAIRCPFTR